MSIKLPVNHLTKYAHFNIFTKSVRCLFCSPVDNKRYLQYRDDIPRWRGGATKREHMLDNIELQKRVKLLKEYTGVKPDHTEPIYYKNRNPRNLELLGYNTPRGFGSLREGRSFYNKLNLYSSTVETMAWVENVRGVVICSASTSEPYIADQIYRPGDVMSIVNIARIIGQRMKECGVERVCWDGYYKKETRMAESEKIREFYRTLVQAGITLTEPKRELEGYPQDIPPEPPARAYPHTMKNEEKKRHTFMKKETLHHILTFRPGMDDMPKPGFEVDHMEPEL